MTLIEIVISTASFFLKTQRHHGAGLKYYWIRNNNFNFSHEEDAFIYGLNALKSNFPFIIVGTSKMVLLVLLGGGGTPHILC